MSSTITALGTSSDVLAPAPQRIRFERQMGDTEASYYLPSRENGVNDMYLHLGLAAPTRLLEPIRVSTVWAILRLRHPLWAAKVEMNDYEDIRFVYNSHASVAGAVEDANQNIEYRSDTKDQLIDSYLNGPRTLSNDRLTYLILSKQSSVFPTPPPTPLEPESISPTSLASIAEYDFLLCVAHFVGDGMALHTFANDFLGLLGGSKSTEELQDLLNDEWKATWVGCNPNDIRLPPSLEDRLPLASQGKFQQAAARVDFDRSQAKLIGGHAFPRRGGSETYTIVPTVSIDEERTKKMLKTCKSYGVSISAAIFPLCNWAWAKTTRERTELPIMMYSAINLRPYLRPSPFDSYCFLSIGYFNVILPSFFPGSPESETVSSSARAMFWHRAKMAKKQSTLAGANRMVISRARAMANERAGRSRVWAKEDDEKANGTWKPPVSVAPKAPSSKAPSTALIGVSLLGNLDGMYKHASFPEIKLHTLTTGSRQRSGAMLLFGYTFVGKLWVSLGYDKNGFDNEVVDTFWRQFLRGLDELLVA